MGDRARRKARSGVLVPALAVVALLLITAGVATGGPRWSSVLGGFDRFDWFDRGDGPDDRAAEPPPVLPPVSGPPYERDRASRPATVVSLTFDDGDADQLRAAASMRANALVGTFYVVSGVLGQKGYLTVDDVRRLAADGNEIGGHTVNHLPLNEISAAEAGRQVCNDRANLLGWGLDVTSFAFPYAEVPAGAAASVRECGYNSARSLDGVCTSSGQTSCTAAETIPPADRFFTRAPAQVERTWTQDDLRNTVTRAQRAGGGWVQLTFHHVCDDCGPVSVRPAVLDAFLVWLKQQVDAGGVAVQTVHQVVGGAVAPPVRVPVPPPGAKGVNLLANPSLEAVGRHGPAACWARAGYGRNAPSAAREATGHTGGAAGRITLAQRVSGDAKLMPKMDLGQCAPTAVPAHVYSLQAWYRSDVRTQFAVYYRTPRGAWVYWTSSPWFSPSHSVYAQARWVTPPVPRNATGLSFGLSISSNGYVTTDDYVLSDVS